jgi:homoserine O-acetyltransferase
MSIARGIGQVSYRSEYELEQRFGHRHQDDEQPFVDGRYAVESYLEYHGDRLDARFDANTYIVLSEAMNHHDVGRRRGGIAAALARIDCAMTVAGITSDRLYPLRLQYVDEIDSAVGHDGFLVEVEAVGKVIRRNLTG